MVCILKMVCPLWHLYYILKIALDMSSFQRIKYSPYAVKPVHAITSIKQSLFSCPVIENFIGIEPILRGYLSYKATFSMSQSWPLNTVLTVLVHIIQIKFIGF